MCVILISAVKSRVGSLLIADSVLFLILYWVHNHDALDTHIHGHRTLKAPHPV